MKVSFFAILILFASVGNKNIGAEAGRISTTAAAVAGIEPACGLICEPGCFCQDFACICPGAPPLSMENNEPKN
ncbi:hypothetical protein LINGRAPRIM_LOCUS1443 [Linum grandiflorum]